jgi:SAM-dependent methyltransferase
MKKLQNLKGIGLYCGDNQDLVINKNNFLYFTNAENLLANLNKSNTFDFIILDKILQSVDNFQEYINKAIASLKSGGILIFIVPDFTLYEKELWPSFFNSSHKQSFSKEYIQKDVNRDNHWHMYDIRDFVDRSISDISCELDDTDFDFEKPYLTDQTKYGAKCELIFKLIKF